MIARCVTVVQADQELVDCCRRRPGGRFPVSPLATWMNADEKRNIRTRIVVTASYIAIRIQLTHSFNGLAELLHRFEDVLPAAVALLLQNAIVEQVS